MTVAKFGGAMYSILQGIELAIQKLPMHPGVKARGLAIILLWSLEQQLTHRTIQWNVDHVETGVKPERGAKHRTLRDMLSASATRVEIPLTAATAPLTRNWSQD